MLAFWQLQENLNIRIEGFFGRVSHNVVELAQQIRRKHGKDFNDLNFGEVMNSIHRQIIERIDPSKGDHQKYKVIRRCSIRRFSWQSNSWSFEIRSS
jgi:hypothetical protein